MGSMYGIRQLLANHAHELLNLGYKPSASVCTRLPRCEPGQLQAKAVRPLSIVSTLTCARCPQSHHSSAWSSSQKTNRSHRTQSCKAKPGVVCGKVQDTLFGASLRPSLGPLDQYLTLPNPKRSQEKDTNHHMWRDELVQAHDAYGGDDNEGRDKV
eukprot:695179-Pelagomonas_calceolata.AAC.4